MKNMDYFRLEQDGSVDIGKKERRAEGDTVIYQVEDMNILKEIDYIAKEGLVSGRMNQFLKSFLPKSQWNSYVFMDTEEQEEFYQLEVEEYQPEQIWFEKSGKISGMQMELQKAPRIFQVVPEGGNAAIILHLSLVEAILRRGIYGFVPVPIFVI